MKPTSVSAGRTRPGYVLIVVLMVVAVLSLAAYRFTEAMAAEHAVAVRSTEAAQAKAFALSGIHYAVGALADPDTVAGTLGGNPTDAGALSNFTVGPTDGPRGGGRFTLFNVADTFNGSGEGRYTARFGVSDESGKLNLNALIQLDPTGQVLHDALMKLPNMTEEIADALVDWVDPDDTQRTAGAESAYYTGLGNPYRCKNGPVNTADELMSVRGVTPQMWYGTDLNRNGRMDPNESGDFNRGWSEFLTVYGRELDVDVNGASRLSLADTAADPLQLSENLTAAVGQEMSDYILYYMMGGATTTLADPAATTSATGSTGTAAATGSTGATGGATGGATATAAPATGTAAAGTGTTGTTAANATGTAADLSTKVQEMLDSGSTISKPLTSVLDVYNTVANIQIQSTGADGSTTSRTVTFPCPINDPNTMKDVLPSLLDATTCRTGLEMIPRINVNYAPPEVLAALPGLTEDDVAAITAARGALPADDLAVQTGAWMVTAGNLNPSTFKALEKYVTGRSMTYRVHSVGYFGKVGGATARMEAVIDTNQGFPRIVYFRDLTDLGRGFDLPR